MYPNIIHAHRPSFFRRQSIDRAAETASYKDLYESTVIRSKKPLIPKQHIIFTSYFNRNSKGRSNIKDNLFEYFDQFIL